MVRLVEIMGLILMNEEQLDIVTTSIQIEYMGPKRSGQKKILRPTIA